MVGYLQAMSITGFWTYCMKEDERKFCGGLSAQDAGRPSSLHPRRGSRRAATTARGALQRGADRDSTGCSTIDGARGGCAGARWRFLWNAAVAGSGSESASGEQKTSQEISLCRRTTTTEMLPMSVEPARVFVLQRARGWFGLESLRLQIEVWTMRAGPAEMATGGGGTFGCDGETD
ncbi:uncharacterized protein LOC132945643 [Metopolophium dirhodum]|uniref:uncharacterized protein LOC132945643 n=1 Tax=Metopolophium dirhodum TaxID=44670 RepID=UPI00298F83BD|nr:uncharacterized protein LOC132945643 [Metopolophium dirhodum]